MAYKLVYSPESLKDLDRVWTEVWTASVDFDIADKYIADIKSKVRSKCKYPKSGTPLIYMGEFVGIYYVKFKEYMAFYRIHDDNIEVGRVLYARSDYMKTLFCESEYDLDDTEVE